MFVLAFIELINTTTRSIRSLDLLTSYNACELLIIMQTETRRRATNCKGFCGKTLKCKYERLKGEGVAGGIHQLVALVFNAFPIQKGDAGGFGLHGLP
jgi:hypothetical protein